MIEMFEKFMDASWTNHVRKLFYKKIVLLIVLITSSIAIFLIAPQVKSAAKELELFVYSPTYFYVSLVLI
ncbi:hypothetical protein JZU71_01685, partial [bacterium]|nr:hypothetical protein [bacterium]